MVKLKNIYSLCIILSSLFPFFASAQENQVGAPNVLPDERDVNFATGKASAPAVEIAIGTHGVAPFTYSRRLVSDNLSRWSSNWNIILSDATYYDFSTGQYVCQAAVTIGFTAKYFKKDCGTSYIYTSTIVDGSSLIATPAPPYGYDFKYTDADGTVIDFPTEHVTCQTGAYIVLANYAANLIKPNGEKVTFSYRRDYSNNCIVSRRLSSIATNTGYQLHLEYKSNNPQAPLATFLEINRVTLLNSKVDYCAPVTDSCQNYSQSWPHSVFTYTLSGNNATVTAAGPIGPSWTVASTPLSGGDVLISINRNSVLWRSYTAAAGQGVKSVTQGGSTWQYDFTYPLVPGSTSMLGASRTDPKSNILTTNTRYITGQLLNITDELGRINYFQYGVNGQLAYIIPPEGSVSGSNPPTAGYVENLYDARGNIVKVTRRAKAGSPLADVIIEANYPASCSNAKTCNRPTWTKDANGGITNYTYNNSHGGVLTELKPWVAVGTPGSIGSARPLTVTAWTQRYAWTKNAAGQLVQQLSPVWVVSTITRCQSNSNTPVCDSTKPQMVTTYEYGTNGTRESLLVKGVAISSGGTTLRTCYGYDVFDRRISETRPRANLGVCP